jgi:hypothetical protein
MGTQKAKRYASLRFVYGPARPLSGTQSLLFLHIQRDLSFVDPPRLPHIRRPGVNDRAGWVGGGGSAG